MSLWNVPLADIDLGDDEIRAVTDVLRSKWLSMGPVTAEFEQQFAAMVGVKYAFAVTNCTAALHLSYLAAGVGPADENSATVGVRSADTAATVIALAALPGDVIEPPPNSP